MFMKLLLTYLRTFYAAFLKIIVRIYTIIIWIISRKISIVFWHSFLILTLTYFWLNQPIAHDSEEKFLTNLVIVKEVLFGSEASGTYTKDLICINTHYSKQLVDAYSAFGLIRGESVITDRIELATLFNAIGQYNNHAYIVCDIMFDRVSQYDNQLEQAFRKTKNIIVPQHLINDSLIKPIFSVNSALVMYLSSLYSNQFSKFQILWHDSLKSIPICMYNAIDSKNVIKKGWFYFDDGRLCFNSSFIDFKVKDIKWTESKTTLGDNSVDSDLYYYDLAQFLKLIKYSNKEETLRFLKDKIILIGSFEKEDIHNTIYGNVPGILILYNTYLNLKEGLHIIPVLLILVLFVVYLILSYRIFYALPGIKINLLSKINKSSLWLLLSTLLSYAALFSLLSIITYFVFHIIINIYLIALYFSLLELIMKYLKRKNLRKNKLKSSG